jgi:hypothetical protein
MAPRALAFLAVLLAAPVALGQGLSAPGAEDVSRARSLAMGGAYRAVATSNDAIYLNPAGVALGQKYALDGNFALNPETDLRHWSVSVVDSKTTTLAAGLSYTSLRGHGAEGATKGSVTHLALGLPMADVGAIGFSAKYLSFDRPDPTNAITGDVGLLVRLAGRLSAAAVAYNVVDVASTEAPFGAGFGLSYGDDLSFRLAADLALDLSREDDTPATVHAGGEYLLAGVLPVRVGFRRDLDRDVNHVSGGFGFVSPTFGADVAYVQSLDPDLPTDRIFSVTLQFFL